MRNYFCGHIWHYLSTMAAQRATQINFYQLKYRWLDFSEVPCFPAVSWIKEFLEAALEVSQQYEEHVTWTPRKQQHSPMILSEALHASAKRVVLE